LLKLLTSADEFVDTFPIEDQATVERMVRLMSEKLLAEHDSRLVLLIDGLDESPFLTTGNGLPTLFDALSNIRSSAVLTMRTEFWRTRSESLLTGYVGRVAPIKRSERNRRLTLIELNPWTNTQILQLITQVATAAKSASHRSNLETLRETIDANAYGHLYGDIPRKPLFLRILTDFVAENGVAETSLAKLFREWVDLKLRRDVVAPRLHGGSGRSGITTDAQAPDVVRMLAIQAMKSAAVLMTSSESGRVELLPQCEFAKLAQNLPSLQNQPDIVGLALNSLLMPARKHGVVTAVQFAHRAFQEYFLARATLEDRAFVGAALPPEVDSWVERLRKEADE
jgi:hypothetical protein